MPSPFREHPDHRIRAALNGITVVLVRAQMLRRRWTQLDHPLRDIALHDISIIETSTRAIAKDIRRRQDQAHARQDLLDRHERQLADLRRLLDVEDPDMPAVRRILAQQP